MSLIWYQVISLSKVSWDNHNLPCVGLNVAINGVSKYCKQGVSDRTGSKMVILGCDIGVKDHHHFYDMACDFKHEQVQVKLTRAHSTRLCHPIDIRLILSLSGLRTYNCSKRNITLPKDTLTFVPTLHEVFFFK